MLTEAFAGVDGRKAVPVTITELARLKGVSKQAVSKRLQRLVGEGLLTTAKRGRDTMVDLARWDEVTAETTDPAKLLARETVKARDEPADGEPRDPGYSEHRARAARIDADLKELELTKRRGELLPIADVEAAMTLCAEILVREASQISAHAEDIAAAVGKNGASGARDVLKGIEREFRASVARAMTLAAGAGDGEDEQDGETVPA